MLLSIRLDPLQSPCRVRDQTAAQACAVRTGRKEDSFMALEIRKRVFDAPLCARGEYVEGIG